MHLEAAPDPRASADPGQALVALARGVIVAALGGPAVEVPAGAWFQRPAATFVTLTKRGRLHGCIGTIAPRRPLAEDVQHNAIAAAFHDPRSRPLTADELPDLRVEVSVLAPLEPMTFIDEDDALAQVRPHEDGLVIAYGRHQGTFLPQVWEKLPDRRAFFAELKVKAGLHPDFWAPDVRLSRFSLQKWSDPTVDDRPSQPHAPSRPTS